MTPKFTLFVVKPELLTGATARSLIATLEFCGFTYDLVVDLPKTMVAANGKVSPGDGVMIRATLGYELTLLFNVFQLCSYLHKYAIRPL